MINWFYSHLYNTICGIFFAILGYFADIQGAVHVMWAALAIDLITGIMASVGKRKEKFSMSKVFIAIGRAIGATALVGLLFAMDKEMNQKIVASYNIAAWLISGFYAWSASENMDTLTGGKVFGYIKVFISKRVEANIGIDLNKTAEENEKDQGINNINNRWPVDGFVPGGPTAGGFRSDPFDRTNR